jgi:hypothetical protein
MKGADIGTRRSLFVFSRCCLLIGSFIAASSTVAVADKDYPTSIINDPDSPVTLMKCEAWARDINKTILYSHASIPNMLSDLGISFTNNSDKTVTALRLEVSTYDITNAPVQPFGVPQHLDTDTNRSGDKMAVSPGASFDFLGPRSWHPGYNIFQNSDHVSCEITAVRFADGTVWTLGMSSPSQHVTPTPASPAPRSTSTALANTPVTKTLTFLVRMERPATQHSHQPATALVSILLESLLGFRSKGEL